MPSTPVSSAAEPRIHVIHENAEWSAPLFDALTARGAAQKTGIWVISPSI